MCFTAHVSMYFSNSWVEAAKWHGGRFSLSRNPVPGTDGSPRQHPYHSRPLDKLAVWRGAANISTINTEDVQNCLERKLQERPKCKWFFSAGSTLRKCNMLTWSISSIYILGQSYCPGIPTPAGLDGIITGAVLN